jgi:Zn ribbon nucleic-acid-binding protein
MDQFTRRVQHCGRAAPACYRHAWRRRQGTVGLFRCATCAASAVCPACLHSIDVALWVKQGVSGLLLYWCPLHQQRRMVARGKCNGER